MNKKLMQNIGILVVSIILFVVAIIISLPKADTAVHDLIEPITLMAGKTDTLQISDLYFAEEYNPVFTGNDNINIKHDKKFNLLILTAREDFAGVTYISFYQQNELYQIPVIVKTTVKHTFSFKPDKNYTRVNLFGNFNNWNRDSHPMSLNQSTGMFEITYYFEPGQYQYKFFADGIELLDPSNKISIPNGIGGFNSVLNIAGTNNFNLSLSRKEIRRFNDSNKYIFYIDTDYPGILLDKNISAFLDNKIISSDQIVLAGKTFEINVPSIKLKGNQTLRVILSVDGAFSNMQIIKIYDGKPVGYDKQNFSWNDAVIYSIMIDRFNDGDKSNNNPVKFDSLSDKANYFGGDFKGIKNKINDGYFSELGINTIWVSPVNDNPQTAFKEHPAPHRWFTGYHGYWPVSENKVEEKFGTMDELKEMIKAAHSKNIKVLLDFVSHHVHKEHPFYKDHPDWFGKLELPDGRLNLRLWDEHRLTTWFEPYMPSFDFTASKEALETMTENALWWLQETGADGFRHDAVKHVPNIFWRTLTAKLKNKLPESGLPYYQIGETFGDYKLTKSYVNNGQLDAQFNFELFNKAVYTFLSPEASFADLRNELNKSNEVFGCPNVMGNIMDSHDKDRFMAYADNDLKIGDPASMETGWTNPPKVDNPENYKKASLFYAYMMTIPGLPVIYYGSEFGMTGAADPDNRRMMRFDDQLDLFEKQLLKETAQLVKIRNQHPALRYGDISFLNADKDIFTFIRNDFNEIILVHLSKNSENESVIKIPAYLKIKKAKNLINGETINIFDNSITIKNSKNSYSIYQLIR